MSRPGPASGGPARRARGTASRARGAAALEWGMRLPALAGPVWAVFRDSSTEIIPLFILALLLAALIEEYVSERAIARFLTGRNPGTMLLASVLGALIPLCTCGMVPLAVSLRRRGGDLKHVFGFLTAGAAVSVPVLLLTASVLSPAWAGVRFLASVLFGLVAGYASILVLRPVAVRSALPAGGAEAPAGSRPAAANPPSPGSPGIALTPARASRVRSVLRRFRGQLIEYAPWVLVSLALAAVVDVLVPRHWVQILYGQRTSAGALLAALSGFPFYFCSGAELPLVKELLAKGMGHGPAAAMMLAVPIVNIPTLGVVGKWLGIRATLAYLVLCTLIAASLGYLTGLAWL